MSEYHIPIMAEEVVRGLDLKPNGVYFDGTLGGGGHTFQILSSDPTVKVIATDRDREAIEAAGERLKGFGGRVTIVKSNFKDYAKVLDGLGVDKIDGFLLDLGISSHQIDDEKRGFAYRMKNAPLDMRMDTDAPLSAKEVVNTYSEESIRRILKEYGEERFAPAIARNIVRKRQIAPITTCGELEEIVRESMPAKFRSAACARQSFQAIRIEVNGELGGLGSCIEGLVRRLKVNGRGCVLTFHSLEDRIVKRTFQTLASGCTCPKDFPVCVCGKKQEIELLGRYTASEAEITRNSRSKSAKLRIVGKIIE